MLNIEKNLTPRLRMIAQLVPPCTSVCDIGTDHAYVAIYLAKKGIAQKVIAADIKKGPLLQAEKNIAAFEVSDKVTTRLSDGFSAIKKNEAQCCIIAGMGGENIAQILENEKGCTYFVLQMQTAHRHLREYLSTHGYVIEKEAIAREGNKMYTALLATCGKSYELSQIQKEIGPFLIENRPPLFYDYVRYRLYEIESILKSMGDLSGDNKKREHVKMLKDEYENLLKGELK
ncbi:MAG: SAM-dependent methyltransferase [Clostridia bacterium]|nr:SAM-dependent methyltransferase [Clostridia bacterium]